MNFSKRDSIFVAIIAVLLGVLALGTGKGKGKSIPMDDRHRPSYDALKGGKSQAEVQLVCTTCHSNSSLPLPAGHPPKEQCFICHQLMRQ